MCTDLVARIRKHEGAYLFPKTADALLKEAADEIERLNEQLHKAFGIWPEGCNPPDVPIDFQPDDTEALRRG